MDQTTALLNQLRDIHLPPPVATWPWAPGWYILIVIILLLIIGGAVFFWLHYRRKQRLKKLHAQLQAFQATHDFASLSALLRRVALRHYPRIDVAGLYGNAWLDFLDAHNVKNAVIKFQSPIGKLLLKVPYQKTPDPREAEAAEQLFVLAENWLQKHY